MKLICLGSHIKYICEAGVAFEELPDQKEAGGAGGEAKAPEKPKDERSWIMKNWMIALPVALLVPLVIPSYWSCL